jgi:hypothetical protein
MELKDPLPCSQGPGPYTEPDTSSPHLSILFPQGPF